MCLGDVVLLILTWQAVVEEEAMPRDKVEVEEDCHVISYNKKVDKDRVLFEFKDKLNEA